MLADASAEKNSPRASRLWRAWTWAAVVAIVVITALHYFTHGDLGNVDSHTLFRRLYYLPIAMLAVAHGVKGGGLAAGVVVAAYVPHAFLIGHVRISGFHFHGDPAPTLEKVSELVLYMALALLVGFAVDRARLKQIELDDTRAELERAARLSALGELVAGVAHEIKNPLASLHATAEIFLDDYPEGADKRRMAELNFEEVRRLEGIVDRFLDFAKPQQPAQTATEVRVILDRLAALATSTAREREVELRVVGPDGERVVVDPDQILQVLLNLVLNAVEASPKGATVLVAFLPDDGWCEWIVEDEGAGIPTEDRERVFDPFFTSRADGSGLGLSIAARIVEAHGGAIRCVPASSGGARFIVRLPSVTPKEFA